MGFFSRFKKWMGAADDAAEQTTPVTTPAEEHPADTAPEETTGPSSVSGPDAVISEEDAVVSSPLMPSSEDDAPLAASSQPVEDVPSVASTEQDAETGTPAAAVTEEEVSASDADSHESEQSASEAESPAAPLISADEAAAEPEEAVPLASDAVVPSPVIPSVEDDGTLAASPQAVEEVPSVAAAEQDAETGTPAAVVTEEVSASDADSPEPALAAPEEESPVAPMPSVDAAPEPQESVPAPAPVTPAVAAPASSAVSAEVRPRKKKGWFASLFGGADEEESRPVAAGPIDDATLTLRLREAEPRLSVWLGIVLEGVEEAGDELWRRLRFLLRSLDAPADEVDVFVDEFARWLDRMEYHHIDEFRSELQYRLALALDMEDEEDERNRLFLKISDGLARTREQFSRQLNAVFSGHGELTEQFWEELEELFIMADLGYEASLALVERLRKRAADNGVIKTEGMRAILRDEIEEIFRVPRKITAYNPPEVILFIGVNGVGKTTTIAKLAYRARMQGKKVMIAAADTFRAAAIEQLQVWADRVGALFHARAAGSDPASVAFEAMDRALAEQVDILFVDTAGRLQTKHNLMEELAKIRAVLGKKHPGAPHRTILALDATTGQNALSQAKLFKEAAGVDELILTKLDGTAKGGVAIAVAMQEHLPISYIGLGEKLEDLRPFNGDDYARALLGEGEIVGTGK